MLYRRLLPLTMLACLLDYGLARAAAQTLATITVNVDSPGEIIPADFAGLSMEVDDAAREYLGPASSPNLAFYQLLKNLGQGTIRIGGDSGDYSCWDVASAPKPEDCRFAVTPGVIDGYLKASADTGWTILFNVNLAQNSARWAVSCGRAIVKAMAAYPGSRVIVEFGNEPNLYPSENIMGNPASEREKTIRPRNYSWKDLVGEWSAYISAFHEDPGTRAMPLAGPAYDTSTDWINLYLGSFLDGVGARNLAMATVHEYPTNTCSAKNASEVTIPNMLSQRHLESYVDQVLTNDWIGNARRRGLALQLDETGYTACANKPGVNNVFAETLWGLDWLFTNMQLGFRGVNFYLYHGDESVAHATATPQANGTLRYTALAEPGYYALYVFSQHAQGKALVPAVVSSNANIKAYAVRAGPTGRATVFVLNKDLAASGTVSVELSAAMGPGSLLLVRAPALNSTRVSYGEATFDASTGQFTGTPQSHRIEGAAGRYSFDLPNASIAVLTIQPGEARRQ